MFERFFSSSKVVFGAPHTFGWVRCSALDANDLEAWERPDGRKVQLPRGARLARIRGSRGQPILLRQGPGWPLIDAISDGTGRRRCFLCACL